MAVPISHALVLPDQRFSAWFRAAEAYTTAFERVVIVRTPEGYDLNRFRNVSAVQARGVWQGDDALKHIQREFPNIVKIDVIDADTPGELRSILEKRAAAKDRFGENTGEGTHVFERFVIGWASEQRPARIDRLFATDMGSGRKYEGIDIHALKGSGVRAMRDGTVTAVVRRPRAWLSKSVQVASTFQGQSYIITYGRLQSINVRVGQVLKQGDKIAEAAGDDLTIIVQRPGSGLKNFAVPDVIDPMPLLYWDGLRLRVTADGVRIRERPTTESPGKGQLYLFDNFDTLETHGMTLAKVGHEDQWIRVRSPMGIEGFAAAWFLSAQGQELSETVNMTGVNLDIQHHLGRPAPERLRGLGWVRFAYNVSQGRGSVDFNMADRTYRPYIEGYANAGLRPIIVLGHQTYGEGAGYNWHQMTPEKWQAYTRDFANACREVVRRYTGTGLIGAYQIWNEQDTPPHLAQAAVALTPAVYAHILSEAIRAIRSVDPATKIITGGHISGGASGPAYAKATLRAMPSGIVPDGIAFHAYGLGSPGGPEKYAPFGSMAGVVRNYTQVMDAPVWLTEWGVLDVPNEPARDIARYAVAVITELKSRYPDKVMAAVWYGYADTMHNGYGLVDRNGNPKSPLYEQYLRA